MLTLTIAVAEQAPIFGDLPLGNFHVATLLPNGKVVVAGGGRVLTELPPGLAAAEVYDPAVGTWAATGTMTAGRWWPGQRCCPAASSSSPPAATVHSPCQRRTVRHAIGRSLTPIRHPTPGAQVVIGAANTDARRGSHQAGTVFHPCYRPAPDPYLPAAMSSLAGRSKAIGVGGRMG